MKSFRVLLSLLPILGIVSCGEIEPEVIRVEKVSINDNILSIGVGEEYQLTATISPSNTTDTRYNNYLSEDGSMITEINNNPKGWESYPGDRNREVFMRMKDMYGRACIRFIGVFKYERSNSKKCTHKRIATQVNLRDLLP